MARLFLWLVLLALPALAQTAPAAATAAETDRLALSIAGPSGTPVERAQRLVDWTNRNLTWSATDYQERTSDEIIARRSGNCSELSKVLARLLQPTGIRYRWVAEINLQPLTPRRQQTAEAKVKEKGNHMSVFGLRHNDHRWLEIADGNGAWVPADPSIGVIGTRAWLALRMALGPRPQPAVPAVAAIVKDMKVPFVVFVPSVKGAQVEDRTRYYLVDEFNRFYDGRLGSLPAWKDWVSAVDEISPLAIAAFAGKVNLHDSTAKIAHLEEVYDLLRKQAAEHGLLRP